MDILENWNSLNSRMKNRPELINALFPIHMGMFDDLRKNGHRLKKNGSSLSELAAGLEAEEKMQLAVQAGQYLIKGSGTLYEKTFVIEYADYFPNCIFIVLAAILENLDGAFDVTHPDKKMKILCRYETVSGSGDPLGKILPVLEKCYPWIALRIEKGEKAPTKTEERIIPHESSSTVFIADSINKIDTMRTVLSGTVNKGRISIKDVMNITDGSGRVLGPQGAVIAIFSQNKSLSAVSAGQKVDELLIATEIPSGDYRGVLLVDGDRKLSGEDGGSEEDSTGKEDPAAKESKLKKLFLKLFD